MTSTRRALLIGAAAITPLLALGGCAVSFATVQTYVADATAAFDKLVPLVSILDPASAAQLSAIKTDADAAAAAFAALTAPTSGAVTAQIVLTTISDGFTIIMAIPGLPVEYVAAIGAAQLLLVAVGAFFNISPAVAKTAVALDHPDVSAKLWNTALDQYLVTRDKAGLSATADAQVRAFLAAP